VLKHITSTEEWSEKNVAQKGFTLIELLVVIAVLGILAVVGVLAFGGITNDAKASVNKTEMAEVKTAAKAYKAATGNDVTATADLQPTYIDSSLRCAYTWAAGVPTQGACTH
jgi:prepilin-type N-terminal cleavage/methylation domain-containing protein